MSYAFDKDAEDGATVTLKTALLTNSTPLKTDG